MEKLCDIALRTKGSDYFLTIGYMRQAQVHLFSGARPLHLLFTQPGDALCLSI